MPGTQTPIDLYYWTTPNGFKITILLEELGAPYNVHFINIGQGDQFAPDFLKISPNNKIPAIVDPDGPGGAPVSVFESGAILIYLAGKFGRFYPTDPRERIAMDEWLFWQMGGFGPMLGQNHHFRGANEQVPYAIERYQNETNRLYKVLDTQLQGREFVTGNYTIADMAIFGWAVRHERHKVALADYPNVNEWYERLMARPAVQRGLAVAPPKS